jgi:hypothetical protein
MVHRFYHMWQQSDCSVKTVTRANPSGCFGDLYPYVGIARGDDTGANSMGFFNMHEGDAPVLKKLADKYSLSDNFARGIDGAMMIGSPVARRGSRLVEKIPNDPIHPFAFGALLLTTSACPEGAPLASRADRGIRFAHDSLVEGGGFEPSVPRQKARSR